jgi:hypothetical protein
MALRKLRVVPEGTPGTQFDIKRLVSGKTEGESSETLVCGSCGEVLIKRLFPGALTGILIRCWQCAALNDVNP